MMTLEAKYYNPILHDGETSFFIFMCALRLASLVDVLQASFEQHQAEETAVRLLLQIAMLLFPKQLISGEGQACCGGKLTCV